MAKRTETFRFIANHCACFARCGPALNSTVKEKTMYLYPMSMFARLASGRAAWLILATGILLNGANCGTAADKAMGSGDDSMSGHRPPDPPPPYIARIANGTLRITGTGSSNTKLALRLRAGDANTLDVDVGNDGTPDFSFDRGLFDHIVVMGGAGDDEIRIDEVNGVFTDTEITTLNGGNGNDRLIGGSGAETLIGGPGNDIIDGNRGNDIVLLGPGDDTFIWDPGDGSDVVEGQEGNDVMIFNGANAPENVDLSANGSRLRFFRDV